MRLAGQRPQKLAGRAHVCNSSQHEHPYPLCNAFLFSNEIPQLKNCLQMPKTRALRML